MSALVIPLNSWTASIIAIIFRRGARLDVVDRIEYEPAATGKILHRSSTSRRTSSGVAERQRLLGVHPAAPERQPVAPYRLFSPSGSMPAAEHCTGLRMSKPASMNEG
jgi:hypothetical protein